MPVVSYTTIPNSLPQGIVKDVLAHETFNNKSRNLDMLRAKIYHIYWVQATIVYEAVVGSNFFHSRRIVVFPGPSLAVSIELQDLSFLLSDPRSILVRVFHDTSTFF